MTTSKKKTTKATKTTKRVSNKKTRRAVVIGGARTPFVKAFGPFLKMDTIAIGCEAVEGLPKQDYQFPLLQHLFV
jgi:acetyl-CoA acyltransferase